MRKSAILYQFINDMKYWLERYSFDFDYGRFGLCHGFCIRKDNLNDINITIYPERCLAILDDYRNDIHTLSLFNTDHRKIRESDAYSVTRAICAYIQGRIDNNAMSKEELKAALNIR